MPHIGTPCISCSTHHDKAAQTHLHKRKAIIDKAALAGEFARATKKAAASSKKHNYAVKTVKFETRTGLLETKPSKMKPEQIDDKLTRLDHCFVIIFPLLFIVFNLIYWLCIHVAMHT